MCYIYTYNTSYVNVFLPNYFFDIIFIDFMKYSKSVSYKQRNLYEYQTIRC